VTPARTGTATGRQRLRQRPRTVPTPVLITLIGLASAVAQSFGRFTYALLLPAMDRDLLDSYTAAGLLGTTNLVAYLLGTVVVSSLARRSSPRGLLLTGLAVTTVGLLVMSQAEDVGVLGAGLAATGFGGALIWVPAPGLAGSVVSPLRRGAAIGVTGAGVGLGIVGASGLAAVLHRTGGDASWRTVLLVEATVALGALVLCAVLLRPPPRSSDTVPPRAGALRLVPGWVGVTVAYGAFGLSYSIYSTYVVTALEQDAGFSSAHASLSYTLMGLAHVGGGLMLGRLSDTVGRRRTLVRGHVVMAAAVALVAAGAEPLVTVSVLAFGLCMSGLPAVVAAHLSDHLTTREFAGAFGRCTLFLGVAQAFGPPLGGWVAEQTGSFDAVFALAAGFALVAAIAASTRPTRPADRTPLS
jgi:predicted MFS family arabinose efflux permease